MNLRGFAAAAVLASLATGTHGTVLSQLGDQDLADGMHPVTTALFEGASAGDPAPFNIVFGSDPGGTLGSLSYVHSFAGGSYFGASISIGLVDHDSFTTSQDTVAIYFDGVAQDTTSIRGISIAPSSAHVVTFDVDQALLTDGLLVVQIAAIAPAQGFTGNSIGVDFSRLEFVSGVPEPASMALMALGIAGLSLSARRRT